MASRLAPVTANKVCSGVNLRLVSVRSYASSTKSWKVSGDGITATLEGAFKTHKFDSPPVKTTVSKEDLMHWFKEMTTIRRMEILADNMYKQKKIRGFLHLYNGQEAIVSGMEAALTKDDHIITAYRDHGLMFGRGGTVKSILAELQGKSTGCSQGKGGSMHMYSRKLHFHGGNGIVGAQCPVGAGVAFGLKYNGMANVCVSMYGDGAANQGQLFEAMNMAHLWKLPALFACENNKYGMGTSAERSSASTDYYTRGDYMPGLKIDAMNVIAVREGVKHAAAYAKAGKGPVVLEFETYRYMGHSMSDPGLTYRTREEVAAIRSERDPITRVRNILIESGFYSEEEVKKVEKQIKEEVEEAGVFADQSKYPAPEELYTDVYSMDKPYFVRAVDVQQSVVVSKKGGVQHI